MSVTAVQCEFRDIQILTMFLSLYFQLTLIVSLASSFMHLNIFISHCSRAINCDTLNSFFFLYSGLAVVSVTSMFFTQHNANYRSKKLVLTFPFIRITDS